MTDTYLMKVLYLDGDRLNQHAYVMQGGKSGREMEGGGRWEGGERGREEEGKRRREGEQEGGREGGREEKGKAGTSVTMNSTL